MAVQKRSPSKNQYYVIVIAVLAVLLFGASLLLEKKQEDIAKTDPKVKKFLEEAPNAFITVANFEKTGFEEISEKIKKDCNNQNVQAKNYSKVKFFDENSGREMLVWIDWENKAIECMTGPQTIQGWEDNSQNLEGTSSECQAGWKCKGAKQKAFQNSDCSWKNETNCGSGCSNGECLQDSCNGIVCSSRCDGNNLKFNGKCVDGNCIFDTNNCAKGCANAACEQAPCKTDCNDYCANSIHYYNGQCTDGNCVFLTTQCFYGCEGTLCKRDPCAGISCSADQKCVNGSCTEKGCYERHGSICASGQTCSGSVAPAVDTQNCCFGTCLTNSCAGITCPNTCEGTTRKFNGQCVNGQCQYSSEQCSYRCENAACVADPCAGITCADTCDGSTRKYNGQCTNGTCQFSTETCAFGCSNGACKTAQSYGCNYVWYQEITNAQTGEKLLKCPSYRPFCRAGYPQCCNYTDAVGEHYNCADCLAGNCIGTSPCASVSCQNYCEGNTAKHLGVCRNGSCEYTSENCAAGCMDGKCIVAAKIFVTSSNWQANLGGISGADAKCQAAASAAGLSGTWIAFISDSTANVKDRLPDKAFKRIDGQIIANSKNDLFDGWIQNPINITEYGIYAGQAGSAWTGTNESGVYSGASCNNWSTISGSYGTYGRADETDKDWIIDETVTVSCRSSFSLYCVSLPP